MILKAMYSFDLMSKTHENLEICLINMDSFDLKNDDYQLQIDRSRTTLPPFDIWGSEPYLIFISRFPLNYLNPLYTHKV